MPKIFSTAVLCKCLQTAKPAPSQSVTGEIRPNRLLSILHRHKKLILHWHKKNKQFFTGTKKQTEFVVKEEGRKYDLCCEEEIEIIYGHSFVFCSLLTDWFQESPYCCCFWPGQDLGADYGVAGHFIWEEGRCRRRWRLIDQTLMRK